jgi:hypothetical protein
MIVTLKGKRTVEASTFAEASTVVQQFRDTADYGSPIGSGTYADWRVGRIFDGKRQIAFVSYNGRVWQGTEWTLDAKEIVPAATAQ